MIKTLGSINGRGERVKVTMWSTIKFEEIKKINKKIKRRFGAENNLLL